MPAGHLESVLWYTGVNTVRGGHDPHTSILLPGARGMSQIYTSVSDCRNAREPEETHKAFPSSELVHWHLIIQAKVNHSAKLRFQM